MKLLDRIERLERLFASPDCTCDGTGPGLIHVFEDEPVPEVDQCPVHGANVVVVSIERPVARRDSDGVLSGAAVQYADGCVLPFLQPPE